MCSALLCVSRQNCSPARYRGPSPGKSDSYCFFTSIIISCRSSVCFVHKEITFYVIDKVFIVYTFAVSNCDIIIFHFLMFDFLFNK